MSITGNEAKTITKLHQHWKYSILLLKFIINPPLPCLLQHSATSMINSMHWKTMWSKESMALTHPQPNTKTNSKPTTHHMAQAALKTMALSLFPYSLHLHTWTYPTATHYNIKHFTNKEWDDKQKYHNKTLWAKHHINPLCQCLYTWTPCYTGRTLLSDPQPQPFTSLPIRLCVDILRSTWWL